MAMRMPISRVRSVTETKRMFMIPMPPTSSEIDATMASSAAMTWLLLSCASAIWLRLRTLKSSSWPGWMWWRRARVRGHLVDRRGHHVGAAAWT